MLLRLDASSGSFAGAGEGAAEGNADGAAGWMRSLKVFAPRQIVPPLVWSAVTAA